MCLGDLVLVSGEQWCGRVERDPCLRGGGKVREEARRGGLCGAKMGTYLGAGPGCRIEAQAGAMVWSISRLGEGSCTCALAGVFYSIASARLEKAETSVLKWFE